MGFLRNKKAQIFLELPVAVAVIMLFLMGTVRLLQWFGDSLAIRSTIYKASRIGIMANPNLGNLDLIYNPPPLSIFSGSNCSGD